MPILEARRITKRFPGVTALDAVDLELNAGEIHGLVGENGAGKSTLVKILTGVLKPDGGRLVFDQKDVTGWSITEAYKYIGAVYQEREIVPFFTGLQNMFLGIEPGRFFVKETKMRELAANVMADYDLYPPLTIPVKELAPGHVTMIAILKILLRKPKVLIFDEPTASLSYEEKIRFLDVVRRLSEKGLSVLYVSHDLREVLDLCHKVTILRNGKRIATLVASETNENELIRLMIDKDMSEQFPKKNVQFGQPVIEVQDITFPQLGLENISFLIREGEIVGFAGLVGSGRTELARAIYCGWRHAPGGRIIFMGQPFKPSSTHYAIRKGIIMVPENRRSEGLILRETVKNNLTLPLFTSTARFGLLQEEKLRVFARKAIDRLNIKVTSLYQSVTTLSGGNQQKVSIGKWLHTKAKLWIFDEPTQGIDVDTKRQIYEFFGELVAQGAAIWFISSDLKELIAICDRIYVMRKGKIISEHSRPFDQAEILRNMLGQGG